MNRWSIFILLLCILECCCLRHFHNLLQVRLHFCKQQFPSIVRLINSVNSSVYYISYFTQNSLTIKLFCNLSYNVVGLSTRGSTKWIYLAQTYMKHYKHYLLSKCWTVLTWPTVFWTVSQSDCTSFSCLCLILGKYNFGFWSRCCPVVGGHGREAAWYDALSVPPSMTHVHSSHVPHSGRCKVSQYAAASENRGAPDMVVKAKGDISSNWHKKP